METDISYYVKLNNNDTNNICVLYTLHNFIIYYPKAYNKSKTYNTNFSNDY